MLFVFAFIRWCFANILIFFNPALFSCLFCFSALNPFLYCFSFLKFLYKTFDAKMLADWHQKWTWFRHPWTTYVVFLGNAHRYASHYLKYHGLTHNRVVLHKLSIPTVLRIDCIFHRNLLEEGADDIYTEGKCFTSIVVGI